VVHKYIRRITRLESALLPASDGAMTFEQHCRRFWRENKKAFLKVAKDAGLAYYATQFESEDADTRARQARNSIR
jgi:hypothetical protein